MATVTIGCRLPNGIILQLDSGHEVKLNGQNSAQEGSPIILLSERDCGYTDVDASFWEAWKAQVTRGPDGSTVPFAPLASQAIFEAKNERDAKAVHAEVKKEKTGHEPMPQKSKDIEAA